MCKKQRLPHDIKWYNHRADALDEDKDKPYKGIVIEPRRSSWELVGKEMKCKIINIAILGNATVCKKMKRKCKSTGNQDSNLDAVVRQAESDTHRY